MTIVVDDGQPLVESRLLLERVLHRACFAMMQVPYPKWRELVLQLNLPLNTKYPVDQEVALVALQAGRFAELMKTFVLERGDHGLAIALRDTESEIEWRTCFARR